MSYFQVKNRRSTGRQCLDSVISHKTFRLCIIKDDGAKLFRSSIWPSGFVISPWFKARPKQGDPITDQYNYIRGWNTQFNPVTAILYTYNDHDDLQSQRDLQLAVDVLEADAELIVDTTMHSMDAVTNGAGSDSQTDNHTTDGVNTTAAIVHISSSSQHGLNTIRDQFQLAQL